MLKKRTLFKDALFCFIDRPNALFYNKEFPVNRTTISSPYIQVIRACDTLPVPEAGSPKCHSQAVGDQLQVIGQG